MKFRGKDEAAGTREETRELAEALGLFGSAMRHAADRRAARMPMPAAAEAERRRGLTLRLALAPALAVAAAVAVPAYSHFHEGVAAAAKPAAVQQQETKTETRASVDDTVLMKQVDYDLEQEVPDALQPLAELSEQAAAKTTNGEKENASQE